MCLNSSVFTWIMDGANSSVLLFNFSLLEWLAQPLLTLIVRDIATAPKSSFSFELESSVLTAAVATVIE
jgi:hypothetical protein